MSRRPRATAADADDAEILPEADRLEGSTHPRETHVLFGQDAAERELSGALSSGRMHHAWLLTGREGIGKATLAYRFARAALATGAERDGIAPGTLDVPPEASVSRQVRVLSHPGLMLIRRPWQRETKRLASVIPVDEVRRLKDFLQHSAATGAYRVVIIDRAEEMNIAAANALLKSLEEPPIRTVFLLVSSEPGRLLPTVHSRCRRLELRPLAQPDLMAAVDAVLAATGLPVLAPAQRQLVAGLADGSVRRALELHKGGAVDLHGKVLALLSGLPRIDYEAVHQLAERAGAYGADDDFQSLFALLGAVMARGLRASLTSQALPAAEQPLAARLFPSGTSVARLATWAELWETIGREKAEALALNLDRKALILDTFARIEAAARVTR